MNKELTLPTNSNLTTSNEDFLDANPEGKKAIAMQLLGQQQAFQLIRDFTSTADVALLREIRDNKLYKGAVIRGSSGNYITITTFDDYCNAIGRSRSTVNEDIQNLNTFGAAFLEASKRLGLGYRDLRKLRTLPEGELAKLTEAEGELSDDPDELQNLVLDYMAMAQSLEAENKEAKKDLEAKDKVLAKSSKDITTLRTELEKIKNLPADEETLFKLERENSALRSLHQQGHILLGALAQYLAKATAILNNEDSEAQTKIQVHEISSGLCSTMAQQILDAGVDIDFRIYVYPLHLGDTPLRGDAEHMTAFTDEEAGGDRDDDMDATGDEITFDATAVDVSEVQ